MSETDFLKLKKHDNVETNTEKFDIENYLNGNWDKINENAKKTNNQILQLETEKTKLEKELKEAQEDFYQNSIRGQASGEYIHVEDSSNCRAKIGISGNSEQETRSGKNFLELMEGTYSNNGITAVVKNGIVTLNGTAKAISFVGINLLKSIELTNDKAYHLSAFNEKTVGDNTNYCSLRINQDNIQVLFNTANVNGSITTNLKISYITIRTAQGITYNNFVVKPQLELGAGTKEWEQGGISPSPDYRSEIKAVGSNINLFDLENYYNVVGTNACTKRLLDNGISINFTDGSDAFIGDVYNTGTTMTENKRPACIKVKPNTTYTLKMSSAPKCYMSFFDKNYKSVKDYVQITSSNYIFTTNSSTCYIYLRLGYQSRTSGLTSYDFTDIKCVEGTEVGEYSTYGQGSVKVTKCNKNLLDSSILENKILDSKTGSATTNTSWKASDFIQINSGIYNFSWKSSSNYFQVTICFYDRNKNFLSGISWAIANIYSKSFEVDENTTFIRVSYSTIISGKEANREKIILEQNSTETDYEQHEEQSYIIPVQSEMLEGDYFDFDNEEEVHVWGNVIVNGTETINKNSNSEFFSITKSMSQFDTSATGIEQSISNYGTGTTLALGSGNTNNKYSFNASTIYLDCYNSNINTVEKLKVQLTKNNMKIYAKLATPQRIAFTEEQKAVAKELSNARTYKNVTNITTDSKAILSLDYAKDQETQNQKMQNEIDEIKQLLSTTQTSAMLLDNLQKEVESEVE